MRRISITLFMLACIQASLAQPNPDTLWTRTYGGADTDAASCVQQTSDEGYVVAGRTVSFGTGNYDFYLVKANGEGDTLWTRIYGGTGEDLAMSVQRTADGGYIVAGYTGSFGAGDDNFYLVKTGPDIAPVEAIHNAIPAAYRLSANYPNPFNPVTTIRYDVSTTGPVSLKVFDLLGREVATLVEGTTATGSHTVTWDATAFPSGVYLCRMDAGDFVQTRKMVLLK